MESTQRYKNKTHKFYLHLKWKNQIPGMPIYIYILSSLCFNDFQSYSNFTNLTADA